MIREKQSLSSPKELKVVLNWSEEVKGLVPPGKRRYPDVAP
jgi:hypothetical protein